MQDFEVLPGGTTQYIKDLEQELYILRQTPQQTTEKDAYGVIRFKSNKVVQHLLDSYLSKGCDMNDLARKDFSNEDRKQFAQLIGYSVSGYYSLSYVMDEVEVTE